jgi:AcrR family transcriptional regulator
MALAARKPLVEKNGTWRRIVSEARRHFLAHGFRGMTMDDLAQELGMSKKTLYAHFPTKVALVEAALRDKLGELGAELEQITSQSPGFLPALHAMLAVLQRHAEEIRPPFVRDMQRSTPDLFHMVETRRSALIQRHFGRLFAEGRREGMIRRDVPVRLAIAILLAATQGVMNPPRVTELGITPKVALSAILTVVLEGVLTGSGRANR